jgi:hypothetical protein
MREGKKNRKINSNQMERVIYTHIYTQRIAKEIHALHMLQI